MFDVQFRINTDKLDRIERALENTQSGPIREALRDCGVIYFRDMQERFRQNSQGGGEWPKLSPRTIARRRYKGRPSEAILHDTGTLYRALEPIWARVAGKLAQDIPFGVRVGFGGPEQHPEAKGLTISEIARIQHFGNRERIVIPPRPIIVMPSQDARQRMAERLRQGILETLR